MSNNSYYELAWHLVWLYGKFCRHNSDFLTHNWENSAVLLYLWDWDVEYCAHKKSFVSLVFFLLLHLTICFCGSVESRFILFVFSVQVTANTAFPCSYFHSPYVLCILTVKIRKMQILSMNDAICVGTLRMMELGMLI